MVDAVIDVTLTTDVSFGGSWLYASINGAERRCVGGRDRTESSFTYGWVERHIRAELHGALAGLDVTPIRFTYVYQGEPVVGPPPKPDETMRDHRERCQVPRKKRSTDSVPSSSSSAPSAPPTALDAAVLRFLAAVDAYVDEKTAAAATTTAAAVTPTVESKTLGSPTDAAPKSADDVRGGTSAAPMLVTVAMTCTDEECKTRKKSALSGVPPIATGVDRYEKVDCIRLPVRASSVTDYVFASSPRAPPFKCARRGCDSLALAFAVRCPRETAFLARGGTDDQQCRERGRYRAHHYHCLTDAAHNHCVIRPDRETYGAPVLSYRCGWRHTKEVAERIAASVDCGSSSSSSSFSSSPSS